MQASRARFPPGTGNAGAEGRLESAELNVTTTARWPSDSPAYIDGVPRALSATTLNCGSLKARAFSIDKVNGSTPLRTGCEPTTFQCRAQFLGRRREQQGKQRDGRCGGFFGVHRSKKSRAPRRSDGSGSRDRRRWRGRRGRAQVAWPATRVMLSDNRHQQRARTWNPCDSLVVYGGGIGRRVDSRPQGVVSAAGNRQNLSKRLARTHLESPIEHGRPASCNRQVDRLCRRCIVGDLQIGLAAWSPSSDGRTSNAVIATLLAGSNTECTTSGNDSFRGPGSACPP